MSAWVTASMQPGDLVAMDSHNFFRRSAALIAATALAFSVHAQDGAYDPGFGDGGKTWIDVTSSTTDLGQRLLRLPSGNLFMVGGCGSIACAAWLTPSGELATGFGTSGTGTAWFKDFPGWPGGSNSAYDAAAFTDGRIAVPTPTFIGSGHVFMLRADGTGLDPAVGNGAGYVSPSFNTQFARVTAQQQLIVVGTNGSSPAALVVARYDSTLHLDTTFGTAGSTTIGFADGETFLHQMTLQRDGKIVVIGTIIGSPHSIFVVRLTAGGIPDPDFGVNSDGKFQSTFGNTYGANGNAIAEDKKGRLVIAGGALLDSNSSTKWLVTRLLGGGATDPSFNGGQPQQFTIVDSSQGNGPQAWGVGLQSDNRIVVTGTMNRPLGVYYFAMARFWDNGAFDSTWGGGGQSYGDMSSQAPHATGDWPQSLLVLGGGIVVAGYTYNDNNEARFAATRLRTDLLFAADFE